MFIQYSTDGTRREKFLQFKTVRKNIVDVMATWAERLERGDEDEKQKILEETKHVEETTAWWPLLTLRVTGECFHIKVNCIHGGLRQLRPKIAAWVPNDPINEELAEMFNILSGELGRLTLWGDRDTADTYAVNMAQSVERSHYHYDAYLTYEHPDIAWDGSEKIKDYFDPEDPEGRVKMFWRRYHVVSIKDCPCRQCYGEYCAPLDDWNDFEAEKFDRERD